MSHARQLSDDENGAYSMRPPALRLLHIRCIQTVHEYNSAISLVIMHSGQIWRVARSIPNAWASIFRRNNFEWIVGMRCMAKRMAKKKKMATDLWQCTKTLRLTFWPISTYMCTVHFECSTNFEPSSPMRRPGLSTILKKCTELVEFYKFSLLNTFAPSECGIDSICSVENEISQLFIVLYGI